jgi:hypothetical protein
MTRLFFICAPFFIWRFECFDTLSSVLRGLL